MNRVVLIVFTLVLTFVILFVNGESKVSALAPQKKPDLKKMIEALRKEKAVVGMRKKQQEEKERRLKVFEKELEKKNLENRNLLKEVGNREKALQKKIDDLTLDKQIIETYETVEAEQAAKLILDLYKKDAVQVARLIRRLPGEKAGEILNAMIVLDPDKAAILAKKVLDYYKVEKKAN